MCFATTVLSLLPLACSTVPNSPYSKPFDAQGHRGARGLLPENTLPAFELALELGVSTVELDLGITRDREVVVSHDRHINSDVCLQADGSPIPEPAPALRDLDLATVQSFDCGSLNPDPQRFTEPPRENAPGAHIPTLAEVFELADTFGDPDVRFNIEIKIDPSVDDTVPIEEFVELTVGVVQEHEMVDRVTVQSFAWRALELTKQHAPEIQTAALLGTDTLTPLWLNGLDVDSPRATSLGLLQAASAYVDIFSPYWRLVMPGSPFYHGNPIQDIQAAGFLIIPWTVNRQRHMEKLLDLGVDGMITDYPDVLLMLLQQRKIPIR